MSTGTGMASVQYDMTMLKMAPSEATETVQASQRQNPDGPVSLASPIQELYTNHTQSRVPGPRSEKRGR